MADLVVKLQIPSANSQDSFVGLTTGGHVSSTKRTEVSCSLSPMSRSSVMGLTESNKSSMFVMTPDGVIHQRTGDGEYTPEITVNSYTGVTSKLKILV